VKIIFMGTPDFAVPTLNAIVKAGHEVICVVAQPDKPKGRGQKLVSPPTVQRAREFGIQVKQPRAVRKGPFVEWMCAAEADLAVVVAYGRILIPRLLDAPKLGCINVHASLLPKYRGAAPIHWAVINGEKETGVCTMQMNEGMDTGDILLSRSIQIAPMETTGDLWMKLAELGAELLVETIERLAGIEPVTQNHSKSTHAPMLKKADGELNWSLSAESLCNRIRGVNPWPGAWINFRGNRLKIWKAQPETGNGKPGEVLSIKKNPVIATSAGAIKLIEVQLPGKKRGPGINLVNGARLKVGDFIL
jgi:methionyl-tRNA formyltransferase